MTTKKISISFSENYIDIYNYLKAKENISYYICQVVKSEMNGQANITTDLEAKINELIKRNLKENHYFLANNSSQNIITSLSEDDKSLIKDLF